MAKTITIYTTNTCAYCEVVKRFLNTKGLTYTVVNMDEKPEVRQKVIEMSGAMTVPVTVVADDTDDSVPKNITVGWNPAKLASAIQGMTA
jgi:glutaredoxin